MHLKYFLSKNQGFTLIEILVTIALTGILAAITAPGFISWLENKKIDDVSASIEGALKEAQSTSVRRNEACTVSITSTTVSATPTTCLPTGTRTISATGSERNIAVSVTNNTVKFTSKGTTLDTEPFIIYRVNNGTNVGKMKCIVVSSGIGIVRSGTYNSTTAPTVPASLGDAPLVSNPATAEEAAAKDAWDAEAATRATTINGVVNNCISPPS